MHMKNLKNFTTSSLCTDQLVVWGDREGKKNNIFLRLSPLTFTPLSLPTKHGDVFSDRVPYQANLEFLPPHFLSARMRSKMAELWITLQYTG